ncbi:hypothetical protein KIPB_010417, partial [Kipferlia bialata]
CGHSLCSVCSGGYDDQCPVASCLEERKALRVKTGQYRKDLGPEGRLPPPETSAAQIYSHVGHVLLRNPFLPQDQLPIGQDGGDI